MKKITKIIYTSIGCIALMGLNSCNNEKFLDVDHYEILEADQMYKTDADALMGMNGCYALMIPSEDGNADWGFKPNLFTGCHPVMDTQATGWDKDWNTQSWTPGSSELVKGWEHAYKAICRCNEFLSGLESADKLTPSLRNTLEGEGRAVRAFMYTWLAQTFGRVPMLATGETYVNTPEKARAQDYAEMWDFIIEDLTIAAEKLDWLPLNAQYGRCTKGMALAYLGDAYMWKAYRCPEQANENYTKAAAVLKQILDSNTYELNKSFTTLWDASGIWGKEAIWTEVLDEGDKWGAWGGYNSGSHIFTSFYAACPGNWGWGTLFLSWEWYSSFEKGDKRKDGSAVTGAVHNIDPEWKSDYMYGYHPYLQDPVSDEKATRYHYEMSGEYAPSIWSTKYWRTARTYWQGDQWGPTQIHWKRLPNVMFDYAECLFRLNGEGDTRAWALIDEVRNRAFGNLEVGQESSLTSMYLPYYNYLATYYSLPELTSYPLPFNTEIVTVPDAKTYYTQLKSEKGFASPAWLVALGMERRKEFNCEWSLRPDLQRSGFIADHININYPKGVGSSGSAALDDWHTYRNFDFNEQKMDMPIPTEELLKNRLCDQNDAYK